MNPYELKHYKKQCSGIGLLIILTSITLSIVPTALYLLCYYAFKVNPTNPVLEPIIDIITSITSIFLTGLFYGKISERSLSELVPVKKGRFTDVLPLVFMALTTSFVSSYMTDILLTNFSFFNIENGVNLETNIPDAPMFILQIFSVAVIPALVEEFLFRGIILHTIKPYGSTLAILVSSVLFALLHGNITQIPFTFVVGLALGFMTVKEQSIIPAVITHFLINLFSVIVSAMLQSNMDETLLNIIYFAVILIVAVAGLVCAGVIGIKKDYFSISDVNRIEYRFRVKKCFTSAGMIVAGIILILRTLETISI